MGNGKNLGIPNHFPTYINNWLLLIFSFKKKYTNNQNNIIKSSYTQLIVLNSLSKIYKIIVLIFIKRKKIKKMI